MIAPDPKRPVPDTRDFPLIVDAHHVMCRHFAADIYKHFLPSLSFRISSFLRKVVHAMLNHPQVTILVFLSAHDNGSASYRALSDKFGPSVNFNLASLVMSGDVSCAAAPQFVPDEVFFITSKGHQALDDARRRFLLAHKKRTQQEAKQNLKDQLEDKRWRKDARRSWVQWTITTVISLMSFFTGAIVEVFTGFMKWVLALLH